MYYTCIHTCTCVCDKNITCIGEPCPIVLLCHIVCLGLGYIVCLDLGYTVVWFYFVGNLISLADSATKIFHTDIFAQ